MSEKNSQLTVEQLFRCTLRKVDGSNHFTAIRLRPVLTEAQKIDARWQGLTAGQWEKAIFKENETTKDEFDLLIDGAYLVDELISLGLLNGISDGDRVFGEAPTGLINGSNAVFTSLNDFIPETVEVWLNGVRQYIVEDYNTTGNDTITLTSSPAVGERVLINYTKN